MEKKALIVENSVYVIFKKISKINFQEGYVSNFALDLDKALKEIEADRSDVILMNMGFGEKGLSNVSWSLVWPEKWPKVTDSEIDSKFQIFNIKEKMKDKLYDSCICALKNSRKDRSVLMQANSEEKIEELKDIIFGQKDFVEEMSNILDKSVKKILREYVSRMEMTPSMGYFLIKKAQERKIPFVVVTNPYHSPFHLPVLNAAGLEDRAELLNAYETLLGNMEEDLVLPCKKIILSTRKNKNTWRKGLELALEQTYVD